MRLVWLLSAIWLPCYKMANAAQIPNKKNIGLERSENCSPPKTECCHQATLRIRNGCMKKPKQAHVHINWQYIELQKYPVLAETRLTSEAAYSEGEVAALLYRDVPEQQFQRSQQELLSVQ